MARKMTKWSIELSECDITFEARKALKAQMFADFLEKLTPPTPNHVRNGQYSLTGPPTPEAEGRAEGEKNHKKGGLNCVFGNFFFYVLDNCPQVQSLSEFRVYVQRIKKRTEEERTQTVIQVPSTNRK